MAATHVATGTIAGNSIDNYVRSLRRTEHICAPGQHAVLLLDTDFPFTVTPGQDAVLYEDGTKVITGHVVKVVRESPSYDWSVEVDDDFTKLANKFLEELYVTEEISDTATLANRLCGEAGVAATFTSPSANVPAGVDLGLRPVWEGLQSVMAYASWYLKFNENNVANFGRVSDGAENFTLTNVISLQRELGDEFTRNEIKVYGSGQIGPKGGRIFTKKRRGIAGIYPDRTAAVGNPLIETQAEADRVASYLISELGAVTDIKKVDIVANPSIRIGDKARIVHEADGFIYNGVDVITSVESELSENGYTMSLTLGERCPRIAGWSRYAPPVYAGTSGSGVFRSTDSGINWSAINDGLPSGNKYVRRMGWNQYDEGMAIVNGGLYYYNGISWQRRTLPAPANTAGDSPAPGYGNLIAVDATGVEGEFNVLTVKKLTSGSAIQDGRSWVYNTKNSGSSWTSVQLQDSSGSGFHVVGIDLSSRFGTAYVVATSGSLYDAGWMKEALSKIGIKQANINDPTGCTGIDRRAINDYEILAVEQSGTEPNRQIRIYLRGIGEGCHGSLVGGDNINAYLYVTSGYRALWETGPIFLVASGGGTEPGVINAASFQNPIGDNPADTWYPINKVRQITLDEADYGSVLSARLFFRTVSLTGDCGFEFSHVVHTGDINCAAANVKFNSAAGIANSYFMAGTFFWEFT